MMRCEGLLIGIRKPSRSVPRERFRAVRPFSKAIIPEIKASSSAVYPYQNRAPPCGTRFRRHLNADLPTPRPSFDCAIAAKERRPVLPDDEVAKSRSQRFPESSARPEKAVPDCSARPGKEKRNASAAGTVNE